MIERIQVASWWDSLVYSKDFDVWFLGCLWYGWLIKECLLNVCCASEIQQLMSSLNNIF